MFRDKQRIKTMIGKFANIMPHSHSALEKMKFMYIRSCFYK